MRAVLLALWLLACKQPDRPRPRERVLLHEDGVEAGYPRLSNDGREILYQSNRTGTWQLEILDITTRTSRPLTKGGNNNLPDWSADNRRIAFVSDRDGNEELYVMNRDGSEPRRLTTNPGRDIHPYFSADGTTLLYNSQRSGPHFDVFALELDTGKERRITETESDETCARYSPDGSQIVLLRNDARTDDIWIIDAHGEHNVTATPNVRDGWPTFGPDGAWIYFGGMDTGTFSIYRVRSDGTQRERLTNEPASEEDARPFVARDGSRIIFNRRRAGALDIVERLL